MILLLTEMLSHQAGKKIDNRRHLILAETRDQGREELVTGDALQEDRQRVLIQSTIQAETDTGGRLPGR